MIAKVKTPADEGRIGGMTVLVCGFKIYICIIKERIYDKLPDINGTFHKNTFLRIFY
ncbi:MAG: hypothetical protein Q8929_16640 [Bacillota bacterium]|jgi:hypothetical protein|nr:hypothetical protein [Bacillota bacterium]